MVCWVSNILKIEVVKKCAPRIIFFNEKKGKIRTIFDVENCCYLTNFLAMQKSDFHMTHVEIIFKLLLFDNFLINVLFF